MTFVVHAATIGTTDLPGVIGAAVESGRTAHRPVTASNPWNRLASIARYAGAVTLTTTGLKALLDKMPQGSGAAALPYPCMSLAGDAPGLTLWSLKQDDLLPKLASGTVHEKMVIGAGLLSLTELSWQGNGNPVQATARCLPLSADGAASYWTKSQAVAPSLAPLEADYEVTSVTWNGTAIPEVSGLTLSIDAPATVRHNVGKTYPQSLAGAPSGGVVGVTARIQCPDSALLRSWGEGFEGSALRSLVIVCKDFAQAAERGSSTVTITIVGTGEVVQAQRGRPDSVELLVTAVKGTTDASVPFTWATA